jgi:predicted N-acyltransferase
MRVRVIDAINKVDPDGWNALTDLDHPFTRHEFLAALENSGCAAVDSGWLPCHLLCESDAGELLGALPLYLKNNSYGEFVFDFAWANAYQQAGLTYYPKLVAGIPFTPASGKRLLVNENMPEPNAIKQQLLAGALELAKQNHASSLHVLFPDDEQIDFLQDSGLLRRKDCQFHWRNRDYRSFDDFLGQLTSVKRKKTKRERRRIKEAGIEFQTSRGDELSPADWDAIIPLYASTFLRRGREPYLNLEFFLEISKTLADKIVVLRGYQRADGNGVTPPELVAVAICFRSATTLYGRYWGAARYIDSLHFETCYYQGIDYCIQEQLQVFEPGTQGEHKIARGFSPSETWSAHWLSKPDFAAAIDEYLGREREHIEDYMDVVANHTPYRNPTD